VLPVETASEDCIAAIAARVGSARLIDNIVLGAGLVADERVAERV
jgi:pantothenate synthetase